MVSDKPPVILQAILVLMIAAATIYLSIVNNQTDLIYSLTGLCFGYYFGQINRPTSLK